MEIDPTPPGAGPQTTASAAAGKLVKSGPGRFDSGAAPARLNGHEPGGVEEPAAKEDTAGRRFEAIRP